MYYHDIFTFGWTKIGGKLWYMAGISIYFISRMPRKKKFGSENQPDRSGEIMVSPEKECVFWRWRETLPCKLYHLSPLKRSTVFQRSQNPTLQNLGYTMTFFSLYTMRLCHPKPPCKAYLCIKTSWRFEKDGKLQRWDCFDPSLDSILSTFSLLLNPSKLIAFSKRGTNRVTLWLVKGQGEP